MQQKFKPITKQLIIAALILVSVTVLSFGIRQVRFHVHRADSGEPIPSARSSNITGQSKPQKLLKVDAEPEYYCEDSYMADDDPDPKDTDESFWDEQELADEYVEAKTDLGKKDKGSKDKSFKGDYAKVKGSKSLEKISLSDHEDLYFSKEGEYWYVSEQPGGQTTKMQVKIDDYTGELIAVDSGYYAKQDPHRIPMSDYEDIYLTDEGETWYVSEQPDGDTLKMQVQID